MAKTDDEILTDFMQDNYPKANIEDNEFRAVVRKTWMFESYILGVRWNELKEEASNKTPY